MSRRSQEEMNFGSDSFLDIIANIVGILIILIVIAGVRVSQQAWEEPQPEPIAKKPVEVPLPEKKPDPILPAEPAYLPPEPAPEIVEVEPLEIPKPEPVLTGAVPISPAETQRILAASEPVKIQLPTPEPKPAKIMPAFVPKTPEPILVSPELQKAIAALRIDLTKMQKQSQQFDTEQQRYAQFETQLDKQLDTARKTLQNGWEASAARKQQLADLKRTLDRTQVVFIGKKKELDEAQKRKMPAEKLRHKLTPVAKVVEGQEIHFQVKNNKVAFVPLMELVERMKPQIQRQRNWLLKYNEHRGRIGPYRGFLLDYTVVRQRLSALEEARAGGVARIMPVLLKFEPQEDLMQESLSEALAPGSVFIRELQLADINTTLTFWVYPDSFGTYRQLKEFAHAEGFTVAARPLKKDALITASPFGSKSAGQ